MKFLKQHSYDIVRLFINQVGIAIFSLVLYFAVGIARDESTVLTLTVSVSAFSLCFMWVLFYWSAWEYGAKDRIRVEGGRLTPSKYHGLKLGLAANLTNFAFAFICTLALGIFLLSNVSAFYTVFGFAYVPMLFTMPMYNGVLVGLFQPLNVEPYHLYDLCRCIGFLLLPLLSVGVVWFGYAMGMENRRILDLFKRKRGSI